MAKTYGKPDEDQTAQRLLETLVSGKDVDYFVLNPRKPINARPCQLPGSLTVQAVLVGGEVITVRQYKVGGEARQL